MDSSIGTHMTYVMVIGRTHKQSPLQDFHFMWTSCGSFLKVVSTTQQYKKMERAGNKWTDEEVQALLAICATEEVQREFEGSQHKNLWRGKFSIGKNGNVSYREAVQGQIGL